MRALGNRVMYGISRVSTITPHALVSAALLAHRRRGITDRELTDRVGLLRRLAADEGTPLSTSLKNAPSSPLVFGPIQDAVKGFCSDELVRTQEVRGEVIYQPDDARRSELAFYKNTLMNLVAPASLLANAILAAGGNATARRGPRARALPLAPVQERVHLPGRRAVRVDRRAQPREALPPRARRPRGRAGAPRPRAAQPAGARVRRRPAPRLPRVVPAHRRVAPGDRRGRRRPSGRPS